MPKNLLRFQNFLFLFMPGNAFSGTGFQKTHFIELTASMSVLDFSDKLKGISCAALIICGGKDHANIKASKRLSANIPCAKLYLAENAGHEVNVDAPEKLAGILNAFW